MQVTHATRTIEFDKVTSTNMIYFETNNHEAFMTMIGFLEIINEFHQKIEIEFETKNAVDDDAKQIVIDNHIQNKFELEVVHRYLNTLLLDGDENRDSNVQKMLMFYTALQENNREIVECLDNFAKQIPIITRPFIILNIEEVFYNKLMSLFTGESYLSRTGFNMSIIMTSKLYATLLHLLSRQPTPHELFMYYLGTRFNR